MEKYGKMETWKHGNMEKWKNGNMEIWKHKSHILRGADVMTSSTEN